MDSVKTTNKVEETKVTSNEETKVEETKVEETKTEETKTEETKSNVDFAEPTKEDVAIFALYNDRGALVKTFNSTNHGKNFVKLAKAYAERNNLVAKPYTEPVAPEVLETNVVHIVTSNGERVRSFSLVAHGKDYEKLAAQFIEKHGSKKGYKVKK